MNLSEPGPLHRTTRIALTVLLVLSHPVWAATIIVDESTCTLVDAITAANTDSPVGDCPAGAGTDTIELTTDVVLSEANNVGNGLPLITSAIDIEGGGFVLERVGAGGTVFRFFGVLSSGTLTIGNLTMRNGRNFGGAIWVDHGALSIANSTLADNSGPWGGAILSDSGTISITNSTLSGNIADSPYGSLARGGAIYHRLGGSVSVINSTLSGNEAYFSGGALFIYYANEASVVNSTLVGNYAPFFGGAISGSAEPATMTSTIVAGNSGAGNCWLPLPDGGNNFADDDSCGTGFTAITPGVDFDTTLADNGGPTETHALLPGSVAIDAAGECGLDTDQRGFPRNDGVCDSGSFEFQGGGGDGGADVPASSRVGLLVLLAVLVMLSWAILRHRTQHPT